MTNHDDHLRDAEFGPVIDRLRAERPTASALELDTIKQQVRSRVARDTRGSGRTQSMRSRLAILGMLVLGMVLSTGGAGLAVSGFANPKGNAAQTQYGGGSGGGGTAPEEEVLGEDDTGGGTRENSGGGSPSDVQPERQAELGVQDTSEQLPFTGFAAIPVLLGGVALLGGGLVLRRRANAS
jgi:hypothetical protein